MKIIEQYKGLRKEIYVICLCKLIDNFGSMVGPMFTLILSTKLGMNAKDIASFFLVYIFIIMPIKIIGGKLCDKVNKKILINICDVATSLIYIICGFLKIGVTTIAIYLVGDVLQAIEGPAYDSLIADFTNTSDRDKAYSLHYLALNLGLVLAPTIGGMLLNDYLNIMFICSGVSELISIIIFNIFVKDIKPIEDVSNKYEQKTSASNTLKVFMQNKVLIGYTIISSIAWLVYGVWNFILPLSLVDLHGEQGSVIYGTMSSVNCLTVIVFTALITTLLTKRSSLSKLALGNIFLAFGYIIFILFQGRIPFYYLAITVFTIGEIIDTTASSPYLTRRIPINYRGRISSIIDVFGTCATSVAEYLIGYIYDYYGSNLTWVVILSLAAVTITGFILLKKADKKSYPELYLKNEA